MRNHIPFGVVEFVLNADELFCSFSMNVRVVGSLEDNSVGSKIVNAINIQEEQNNDKCLSSVLNFVMNGRKP